MQDKFFNLISIISSNLKSILKDNEEKGGVAVKKKIAFVSSFALATLLVVGQFAYAEKSDGMMNMMNGNGMMQMMEAMNSPEGQKMMSACGEFMESNNQETE
jgi:hypothetical protein